MRRDLQNTVWQGGHKMTKLDEINKILGINDSYKAPDRLMEILYGDIPERNKVFSQMAELFNNEWDFDWFHEYFQNEHADRKQKKQDFTPESISKVLNELTGKSPVGTRLDVAAGTGGLTITRWAQDKRCFNPFAYRPSIFFYQAEDLSDRSIPFLLFNLIIRGMNGVVIHGDSITRECYGAWFIQNDHDSYFDYSNLNLLPYNKNTEHMLNVKFIEERYEPIRQSELPTQRLIDFDSWLKQLESDEAITEVLLGEKIFNRNGNQQLKLF